jgi:hypothetical protein
MDIYHILKDWFLENYGHLGFKLSTYYGDDDLILRCDIMFNEEISRITGLNIEKVMDFTVGNSDLRKLLFDALLRQNGYRLDNDFMPLKQMKEFKL